MTIPSHLTDNDGLDLQAFAGYLTEQDRSPVTIRGYISDIRIYAAWSARAKGEPFRLPDWSASDMRAYRQSLSEAGARPHTINRKLAALVAYGHWAVQTSKLAHNPALNIRNVESVPLAPKWLDKRQRAALVRAVENDLRLARQRYPRLWVMRLRDAAMALTLLNTGLRVGELCALQLNDVQIGERKGSLVVRSGKGQKQRTIPLNGPARQLLNEWLAVRPEASGEALFIGQRGERVGVRSVQRAVERAATAAGLQNVSPHTLRHSFAKALLDEGVTLEKVAALLGHNSLNTTRIYTTPGERDLEEAVAKLEDQG
jgi:site-specific recombinase XerD